jgi:hypothetical protein
MIDKKEIKAYLEYLNEYERVKIEGTEKERLVFKNSSEVFELFGKEEYDVLTPFNDYTYEWLNSFLYSVIDLIGYENFDTIDELSDKIQDLIPEWVDSSVSVYTNELTNWLADNNTNVSYLEDSIKENPSAENHLQLAQYKAIEEIYNNAFNILIKHLKDKFQEE